LVFDPRLDHQTLNAITRKRNWSHLPMSICAQNPIHQGPGGGEFFESIQIEQLSDLEAFAASTTYPSGTLLFSEEQIPKKVFFLLDGQVKLSVNSSDGKRFIICIAPPGEILGLASALNGNPYEMTAETLYACRIASMERADFLTVLLHHASALNIAALALSKSYNQACARFRTLSGTPSVAAKVARLLLEFSASGRPTKDGTRLCLALTHQEIGECVGTCRESVSRVMCEFRRRKLIAMKGSILTIRDRTSLERYAASSTYGDRQQSSWIRPTNRSVA
jgi:CRP/FNR family cyclic AMP-dependent transcriptional regulator